MKAIFGFICTSAFACAVGMGCTDILQQGSARDENYGTIDTPVKYTPGEVVVLAVDYTTGSFLGGYTLPVQKGEFELEADYNSPGDFGDVTIFDKSSREKLFAGAIIWMGTGKMTYPKDMHSPAGFTSTGKSTLLPEFTHFYYSDYSGNEHYDLSAVRRIVSRVDVAWKARANAPDAPIYATLYARSVGVGDPTEWYWLVFIRG